MKATTHELPQPKANAVPTPQVLGEHVQASIAPILLMNTPLTSGTGSEGIANQDEAFWRSISSRMLGQAFQTLLDWLWAAIKERYAEEFEFLSDATELSEALLDTTLSLTDKCTRIVDFLETQKSSTPQIKDQIALARILLRIVTDPYAADSTVLKRSINALQHLDDLLNNPAVQALADQSSISPLKTLIATLKDWALWIERLSKASWQSPEVMVKHLVEGNVLPGWMND